MVTPLRMPNTNLPRHRWNEPQEMEPTKKNRPSTKMYRSVNKSKAALSRGILNPMRLRRLRDKAIMRSLRSISLVERSCSSATSPRRKHKLSRVELKARSLNTIRKQESASSMTIRQFKVNPVVNYFKTNLKTNSMPRIMNPFPSTTKYQAKNCEK